MSKKRNRDAATGQIVTAEYAAANPDTTVSETIETRAVPEAFWRTQALWCAHQIDWHKEHIAEMKRMKEFCEAQIQRMK